MTRLAGLVVMSVVLAGYSIVGAAEPQAKAKNSPLAMLKSLAGEWTGKATHGGQPQDARVVYKVTAGGSAVVETLFPGTEHEMVTVYHEVGDDLELTHYCVLRNQPHMRAKRGGTPNKVVFEFANATNLKSDKDAHMHNATIELVDIDHLKATWTMYIDGKAAENAVFDLTRKK